jgi:hypothetical protein
MSSVDDDDDDDCVSDFVSRALKRGEVPREDREEEEESEWEKLPMSKCLLF